MKVFPQLELWQRVIEFSKRQGKDIRQGGMWCLARKTLIAAGVVLAIPFVLLVRVLRSLVVIRFGPLPSARIGSFAAHMEVYLCKRDASINGRRAFDFFYQNSPVCNEQLKKMWLRTLNVTPFARPLDKLNRLLPGGERHVIPIHGDGDRDIHGLLAQMRPHLSFTVEEEHSGWAQLKNLGVAEGSPFVCFHGRDPAYLDNLHSTDRNWRYHDYRDSNIHNYIPATEELTRRGYFAVRLGAIVKEALCTTNPKIIDYAVNGRTDFLDMFLGAHCRFFIGDGSGICAIPRIFRRPSAFVNFIPLEYAFSWSATDLFIPKKLWLREEHRFLKFREILISGIGRFLRSEDYEEQGIEVIDNTPEEITDLSVEMDERLKGTWQGAVEDEELQRRFWSLFKTSKLHGKIASHIGAKFLRQNRDLLD